MDLKFCHLIDSSKVNRHAEIYEDNYLFLMLSYGFSRLKLIRTNRRKTKRLKTYLYGKLFTYLERDSEILHKSYRTPCIYEFCDYFYMNYVDLRQIAGFLTSSSRT